MCGTKRLHAFLDYTRPVRYFHSARVYLLLLFMGKIRDKGKKLHILEKKLNNILQLQTTISFENKHI